MIKWLFLFFLVSALVVLQAGFFANISWLATFNIAVIYAVVTVMRAQQKEAVFVVILSGLLLDLYSGLVDGTMTASLVLAALLVSFLSSSILAPISPRLMIFIGTISGILCFNLSVMVVSLALSFFHLASFSSVAFAVGNKILPELILAAILAQPALWLHELKDKILSLLAA